MTTGTSCKPPKDRIKAESLLAFNWRTLTDLGVSWEDAQSIATTLIAKRVMVVYWQRLIRVDVPAVEARRIARAIAKYDIMGMHPPVAYQALIRRYCPAVCRAGLWRVELLLPDPSIAVSSEMVTI
jgi:hypothetical protein